MRNSGPLTPPDPHDWDPADTTPRPTTGAVEVADPAVLGPVQAAASCLAQAVEGETWRLQGDQLGSVLDGLDRIRRDVERVLVATVGDARGRSVADDEGFSSVTDYVRGHVSSMDVSEAASVVKVAEACGQARFTPLADQVRDGAVPVRHAARVVAAVDQVDDFLDFDDQVAAVKELIPTCRSGTDRAVRALCRDLVAEHKPVDEEKAAAKRYQARGLYERAGAGGTKEFVWRLDEEGAAFVRGAIGPLAKPVPDDDGPDPRSPRQRRSDALLAIVKRGMTSPGAAPTTSNAKVFITLSFQQLTHDLHAVGALGAFSGFGGLGARGQGGLGVTMTGEQLTPAAIRRIACEAELVPVVLGTEGQVLDLGHSARLASPAQRAALWLEEAGCTYQGCSMPAQWCAIHHETWWVRGGPTDHDNLHLLCPRHHTKVHEQDLHYRAQPTGLQTGPGQASGDDTSPAMAWQP